MGAASTLDGSGGLAWGAVPADLRSIVIWTGSAPFFSRRRGDLAGGWGRVAEGADQRVLLFVWHEKFLLFLDFVEKCVSI